MGILLNVSLIILSIGGIFTAGYLINKRKSLKPMVCPMGGECEKVLNSQYNQTLGIKNDLLGMLYYSYTLLFAISLFFIGDIFMKYELIIAGAGLLFSSYLVFIQAKVLQAYCFYCLVSAGLNFLIFLSVAFL